MGVPLTALGDFILTTFPKRMGAKDHFVNELAKRGYILPRLLRGRDASETFQSGTKIQDDIFLDMVSTFENVQPYQDSTWSSQDVLTQWEVPWRFSQDHMAWSAQDEELNDGDQQTMFKKRRASIEQRFWTSYLNGIDGCMTDAPNKATMEAAGGLAPMSLWSHMNEQTNTLFNTVTTAGTGGAWTTIQSIDPTSKTRWKSAQQTYPASAFVLDTNGAAPPIFKAFDQLWLKLQFDTPGTHKEYFENDRLFRQVILTTSDGIARIKSALRSINDRTPSPQDAGYVNPKFNGIDFVYVEDMETKALYSKSGATTTLGTEAGANVTGPRFAWANFNYLKAVFHDKYYLLLLDQFHPDKQPTTNIIPSQTWWNLVCTSRQRQGFCYPSASN